MPRAITADSVVRAGEGQVSTELGDRVVLLGAEEGKYFSLNPVGARVWSLLDGDTRVEALCDAIEREYDVSRATCEHDVIELLEALAAQGLVEVVDAG